MTHARPDSDAYWDSHRNPSRLPPASSRRGRDPQTSMRGIRVTHGHVARTVCLRVPDRPTRASERVWCSVGECRTGEAATGKTSRKPAATAVHVGGSRLSRATSMPLAPGARARIARSDGLSAELRGLLCVRAVASGSRRLRSAALLAARHAVDASRGSWTPRSSHAGDGERNAREGGLPRNGPIEHARAEYDTARPRRCGDASDRAVNERRLEANRRLATGTAWRRRAHKTPAKPHWRHAQPARTEMRGARRITGCALRA